MILVVSRHPSELIATTKALRARGVVDVLASQSVGAATELVRQEPFRGIVLLADCAEQGLADLQPLIQARRTILVGFDPSDVELLRLSVGDLLGIAGDRPPWDRALSWLGFRRGGPSQPSDLDTDANELYASGLEEVLQLLRLTGATKRLRIRAGEKSAELVVHEGLIVDATRDGYRGHEVAHEVLAWEEAEVLATTLVEPPGEPDILLPIEFAVLESARRQDESTRMGASAPLMRAVEACTKAGIAGLSIFDADRRTTIAQCGEPVQVERLAVVGNAARSHDLVSGHEPSRCVLLADGARTIAVAHLVHRIFVAVSVHAGWSAGRLEHVTTQLCAQLRSHCHHTTDRQLHWADALAQP